MSMIVLERETTKTMERKVVLKDHAYDRILQVNRVDPEALPESLSELKAAFENSQDGTVSFDVVSKLLNETPAGKLIPWGDPRYEWFLWNEWIIFGGHRHENGDIDLYTTIGTKQRYKSVEQLYSYYNWQKKQGQIDQKRLNMYL